MLMGKATANRAWTDNQNCLYELAQALVKHFEYGNKKIDFNIRMDDQLMCMELCPKWAAQRRGPRGKHFGNKWVNSLKRHWRKKVIGSGDLNGGGVPVMGFTAVQGIRGLTYEREEQKNIKLTRWGLIW